MARRGRRRGSDDDLQPRHAEHVTWSQFGNDVIVYHHLTKQYFLLSGPAAAIWHLCSGDAGIADITAGVVAVTDGAGSDVEGDVRTTVAGLAEFGLLEVGG